MLTFRKINRSYRNANRLRIIVSILVKYGFEDFVSQTKFKGLIVRSIRSRIDDEILQRSRWERVRLMLEELGPTFVKFGQLLSNRPDIIPHSLILQLELLQDQVCPFSAEEVETILSGAWGDGWRELFIRFDSEPVAAASMAQVHYAVLKEGNREVALKVRRPGAEETVEADLEILNAFAHWASEHLDSVRRLNLLPVVAEFEQKIKTELDFQIEAGHLRRFAEQYGNEPRLKVPKVYSDLVRSNLLVLDFIHGIPVAKTEELKNAGHDLRMIAKTGADLILRQIFDHGFFHADPHPGNIFVLSSGALCFLDFGMVGVLSHEQREILADLLISVEEKDARKLTRTLQKMSYIEAPDYSHLYENVQGLLLEFSSIPSSELDMGHLLRSLSNLLSQHRIQVHPSYFLLLKALISVEGISRELDPTFDLTKEIAPFVSKLVMQKLRPGHLIRNGWYHLSDMASALHGLPDEVVALVRQAKRGELSIRFEHEGLGYFRKGIQDSADRMSMAIVLAALLISSSVVILAKLPPLLYEIPILGLIGYVVAGMMALYLLLTSFFRRK